jgi:hypothetical protein
MFSHGGGGGGGEPLLDEPLPDGSLLLDDTLSDEPLPLEEDE